MKTARLLVPLLAVALAPATAGADYLGILKLPRSLVEVPDAGLYSFANSTQAPFLAGNAADRAAELKLGYRYSRYFSVEGQFNDFTRQQDPFSTRATIAPSFHGSGYGIDTVATLPVWRFSFYGRMGAYHGDAPTIPFSTYSTSLLGQAPGTRLRYGLGMRYNVTQSIGVEAQMERYAPLGAPLGEPESDLFSVGLKWRF
ncbi:MAG TPA: outer membrane beta-barrel protein [Usitatibacter sp.]|jgi:hypothetical protein|nr:outer membrane beta-barrel protein [Usitatibacter sp.]